MTKKNSGKKKTEKKTSPEIKKIMDGFILEEIISRRFIKALMDEFDSDWAIAGPSMVGIAVEKKKGPMSVILFMEPVKGKEGEYQTLCMIPPKDSNLTKPTAEDLKKIKRAIEKGAYKTKLRYKPKKK
jgi:hypothetical protein